MRFQPKTSQEIDDASLLDPGLYDFEVVAAEDKESKKGNDMTELTIRIENAEGRMFRILDWLVSTDGGAYKIRHFAETTGLLKQYETGELPAHKLVGKTGRCKITIKPGDGQYRSKNAVADYVGTGAIEANGKVTTPELDDSEIPF